MCQRLKSWTSPLCLPCLASYQRPHPRGQGSVQWTHKQPLFRTLSPSPVADGDRSTSSFCCVAKPLVLRMAVHCIFIRTDGVCRWGRRGSRHLKSSLMLSGFSMRQRQQEAPSGGPKTRITGSPQAANHSNHSIKQRFCGMIRLPFKDWKLATGSRSALIFFLPELQYNILSLPCRHRIIQIH